MLDRVGKEILYCKECGEALESMIPEGINFLGWDRYPRQCLCERTRIENEEKERKLREYEETLSRNRSICFQDKTMYNWNFAHDDGTVESMIHAKNYVEHFDEMIARHTGLLFWGDVGTGKSFMAGCIANALLEKEYTVKMTNFSTIINDLFACEDKNEYIESLAKYSLLIIDDLGAERNTEYATENVFNVIDRRYRSGKPLIVTTNLELALLKQEEAVDRQRIYDRVLEMCVPIRVSGESKRSGVARDRMNIFTTLGDKKAKGENANE